MGLPVGEATLEGSVTLPANVADTWQELTRSYDSFIAIEAEMTTSAHPGKVILTTTPTSKRVCS